MAKTHIVGGVALGYLALNNIDKLNVDLQNTNTLIIVGAGLVIGSLLPDIDHPRSTLSLKVRPIGFIVSKLFRHREYTHSIVGAITMSLLFYMLLAYFEGTKEIAYVFTVSLAIGIISHIFLDMLNKTGVALFYPFTRKRIRLLGKYYIPIGGGLNKLEVLLLLIFSGLIYKFVFV